MARIRTIKPTYWSSPNLPPDPWARLLYIAMWNWADDAGRGTANERELLGFAFPNDLDIESADIRRMLGGIRRAFGVKFYKVGGRPFYSIPSWESHQKIDKRTESRIPAPEDGVEYDPETGQASDLHVHPDSVDTRGTPPTTPRGVGESSGLEVGSRKLEVGSGRGEKTARRASSLPDDFHITADMLAWATGKGLTPQAVERETEKFRDHHTAKGSTFKDWNAAWRTWIARAGEYAPKGTGRQAPPNTDTRNLWAYGAA